MLVLLAMLTVTGCATSGSPELSRQLPPAPTMMSPVATPSIQPKQDARTVASDARKALKEANGRLRDSRSWYDKLREGMAQ